MKAITCWVGIFVTQVLKINDNTKVRKPTKSRQVVCLESLSHRMRKDVGLDCESSDAADYTKYL